MFWKIFVSTVGKISSLRITYKNTCEAVTSQRIQGYSKTEKFVGKRPNF